MTLDQLLAMGATVCGGAVDLNNKHMGTLQMDGSVMLSVDGLMFVEEMARTVVIGEPAPAKPTRGRPRKTPAPEPVRELVNPIEPIVPGESGE